MHFLQLVLGDSLLQGEKEFHVHAVGFGQHLTPTVFAGCFCAQYNQVVSGELQIFLDVSAETSIFVAKKMNRNMIQAVLNDEELLERFGEKLIDEINNDDEPMEKVVRQLLNLCLRDEHADDFFIAICGWSVDSLLSRLDV